MVSSLKKEPGETPRFEYWYACAESKKEKKRRRGNLINFWHVPLNRAAYKKGVSPYGKGTTNCESTHTGKILTQLGKSSGIEELPNKNCFGSTRQINIIRTLFYRK